MRFARFNALIPAPERGDVDRGHDRRSSDVGSKTHFPEVSSMIALAKRIATALITSLAADSALGCEVISAIDRGDIPIDSSAGGHGGEAATTATSSMNSTASTSGSASTSSSSASTSSSNAGTSSSSASTGSSADSTSGSAGSSAGSGSTGSSADSTSSSAGSAGTSSSASTGSSGGDGVICGDGAVGPGEECDDGNLVDLDGCSSSCKRDAFVEMEPNDTVAAAGGPYAPRPSLIVRGSVQPGTDADVLAIEVPATADLRIETFDASGPSSCNQVDTVITLIAPDGTTVLATDDDGGVKPCSKLDAAGIPAVAHVPAGLYYVKITAYEGYQPIPGYSIVITFDALCGDGKKQGHEECDGGAGCTATCDRVPICGDGFVDGAEQCDDGNATSGDGCSAACRYELRGESEPNDTAATAAGPFEPNALLGGAITPGTDVDYFKIALPATADLAIATFDAAGPTSCSGIDTVVTLVGANGTTTLVQRDTGGVGDCAAIDSRRAADSGARHLPAGDYFVRIEDYHNDSIIPGYTVLVTYNARCGDGIVQGAEECDGGAGCSATCDRIPVCGDALVDDPETCDDGNTASGDGCSATCQLETTAEIEPNDTGATANGPFAPFVLLKGAISPRTDLDFFAIDLATTSDLTIETFDGSGPGSCVAIDTKVTLYAADGTTEITSADDGGLGACSRIDASIDPLARHLAAGTHFIKVEDYGNDTLIAAYTLSVKATAVCGDGKVQGGEQCDGGAGCTATCDRVPSCGDGYIDAPETCDDGNLTAGDGCSATCSLESVAELEPNDDRAGADAAAIASAPVEITGSTFLSGSIGAVQDIDRYRMTLTQPAVVRLETFDPSAVDCATLATTLRLRDSADVELYADDNSGVGSCSALVVGLPAGTFYASVEERTGAATIPAYVLQARFLTSLGSEVEPDDVDTAATKLSGTDALIAGDHPVRSDSDFYAITVPGGKSLRAEIIEGDAETCESLDVDSFVTLYDASGVALGSDDDSGRGFCSRIDGTGASPADLYAHHLAAGTYYLLVEASPSAQALNDTSAQFAYRLAVTLR